MAERLRDRDRTTGRLPARGEIVVRGAYVVTMDPALGDKPGADVHIRDGEIVAIGNDIAAHGAEVISGSGMVLLPGIRRYALALVEQLHARPDWR